MGIIGSPGYSSSLWPLCASSIYPTANSWQVQWAPSPEYTMNPPPLLHFYLYTLVQPSLVLPDSSFIVQLLLSFSHNPGCTKQPELSLKIINQSMLCPCLKSFKGFPTGQRTKLKLLITRPYMIWPLPTSTSPYGPLPLSQHFPATQAPFHFLQQA